MTSAEFPNTLIPARNRRQAMDWSLVLISQGIEAVVEQSELGWTLLVEPQDHSRALDVLRQYQLENRGWSWRQKISWPEITFNWGAVAWCLLLALFSSIDAAAVFTLTAAGERAPFYVPICSQYR